MAGIIAYGAYVPFNRLNTKYIKDIYGSTGMKGEKAVANYDEDSLTMAVAAALDCKTGFESVDINRLYFATTTAPSKEKHCSSTIAGTLDMSRNSTVFDITNSLKAGSSAMLAALDASKNNENVMVTISDTRIGGAAGLFESIFGDGAAAFLFGNEKVIAEVIGNHSITVDFYDTWRGENDRYVRNWEERFCKDEGYNRFTIEVGREVMLKTGLKPSDFYKAVIYGLKSKDSFGIAKKLGFTAEQMQDPLIDLIGNTGVASAPMALIGTLESAKPGDKILFITYGEGSDALIFEVTENILKLPERRGIRTYINSKKTDINYGKYLRWKQMLYFEPQKRPQLVRPSLPDRYRNMKKILGFYGSLCMSCNTPQFPPQRVCINCQAIDNMQDYKFIDKAAKLTTYTLDYLAPSLDPPTVMAVVDYEGGGRFVCLMTDCEPDKIEVGMELEMSFRLLFEAEGISSYFWKAIPKR